ncbi:MAG: hypothetical protein V4772_23550 [Pseudomonadota bacterium]
MQPIPIRLPQNREAYAEHPKRRSHRLKLPNAMIWANARVNGWQLVKRNTKDFPPEWAGIRLPYEVCGGWAPIELIPQSQAT